MMGFIYTQRGLESLDELSARFDGMIERYSKEYQRAKSKPAPLPRFSALGETLAEKHDSFRCTIFTI